MEPAKRNPNPSQSWELTFLLSGNSKNNMNYRRPNLHEDNTIATNDIKPVLKLDGVNAWVKGPRVRLGQGQYPRFFDTLDLFAV